LPARKCFLVCPIGSSDSESRRWSDLVLKLVVRPALKGLKFGITRADQIAMPGLITSQIISHLVKDDLVVADLTERNPNVFYEIGIRHCFRKPIVHMIKSKESIPFDVIGFRAVELDTHSASGIESTVRRLRAQVKAACSSDVQSPLADSVEGLFKLQDSDSTASVGASLQLTQRDVLRGLEAIATRIDDPQKLIPRAYIEASLQFALLSHKKMELALSATGAAISSLESIADSHGQKAPYPRLLQDLRHAQKLVRKWTRGVGFVQCMSWKTFKVGLRILTHTGPEKTSIEGFGQNLTGFGSRSVTYQKRQCSAS
jgi:hypothetical protein